ncbi:MAG: sulfite exporter TauE/SafE family protein [Gammaproteobacteria bacterium]|nr:MAG: sulfite exporter TauE/SafE family protein [Gammaproteobacteria bacterium]
MELLQTLLVYLLTGCVAGVLAGLFGIGGGLIIVPALILVFTLQGFDAQILTQLAIGTSLATIVVTGSSAARSHHQKGAVRWPVFMALAPGLAIGVWLGAWVADRLQGLQLQGLIGVFALVVAAQMGLGLKPKPSRELPGRPVLAAVGVIFGSISALFGIGGGSLTVPFLSWCNVRMQEAVGTSAACGIPIALFGALAFGVTGWGTANLPEGSTGYVYWPAVIGVVLTSALCAKVGAQLAHRLSADKLKRVFALFLLVLGIQFIARGLGVF